MPKVRKERTKFHDLAPHSRHLQAAEETEDFPVSLTPEAEARLEQLRRAVAAAQHDGENDASASPAPPPSEPQEAEKKKALNKVEATLEKSFVGLSRGQRRRLAKREAWLRKFDFVGYAREVKEQRQKEESAKRGREFIDFGSFRDQIESIAADRRRGAAGGAAGGATGDACGSERKGSAKISRKMFQRVAAQEIKQYDAILNFPAFQESPLGALKLHLQNTLNLQRQQQEAEEKRLAKEANPQAKAAQREKKPTRQPAAR
ncbi:hypothetical protein BESB_063450 [Besnoitia besnoiti]|uniref:Uncharacterized protein n=1 Tax=Besnoitia besnoiti TaxID=94643 RepID=A0A2A9MAF6_BESBE|nr:hypothetical protein BESB_063450 [Besnoitia besnoiti]PFH35458.1 hypothetical protein BESB_063450 [Besnoitia besnoiti]